MNEIPDVQNYLTNHSQFDWPHLHFCNKIDEDGNADDWFMIPLVNDLVNAGRCLHAGQCYSFKLPPILGGDYAMANAFVWGIVEHFAFYGDVHRQLRDVPDGAKVRLVVKD